MEGDRNVQSFGFFPVTVTMAAVICDLFSCNSPQLYSEKYYLHLPNTEAKVGDIFTVPANHM